jgi:hypothetical protein
MAFLLFIPSIVLVPSFFLSRPPSFFNINYSFGVGGQVDSDLYLLLLALKGAEVIAA